MYRVVWTEKAQKGLKKSGLNWKTIEKITVRLENYLAINPRQLGKPLKGEWKGCYRYRFDDFRVIYQVKVRELIILVLEAGYRGKVYEKHAN